MTHINAFYMNVDEKKQAVIKAKGELQEAETLLKAHPDYKEPQTESKSEGKETNPKT